MAQEEFRSKMRICRHSRQTRRSVTVRRYTDLSSHGTNTYSSYASQPIRIQWDRTLDMMVSLTRLVSLSDVAGADVQLSLFRRALTHGIPGEHGTYSRSRAMHFRGMSLIAGINGLVSRYVDHALEASRGGANA